MSYTEVVEEWIRKMIKYAPVTNGCDNCWSDNHSGCTEQCKEEFKKYGEFFEELRTFATAIHTADCQRMREMVGEMEEALGTATDCKGKKIKLYDAVTERRNRFRSELLTKIDQFEKENL